MTALSELLASGAAGGSGLKLLHRQVYLSGSSFSLPADGAGNIAEGVASFVYYRLIGGGGGASSGATHIGGGGGGVTEGWVHVSRITGPVTVTVGSGGLGSSTSSGATDGGDSSFGSFDIAKGGKAGNITEATFSTPNGMGGAGLYPGGSALRRTASTLAYFEPGTGAGAGANARADNFIGQDSPYAFGGQTAGANGANTSNDDPRPGGGGAGQPTNGQPGGNGGNFGGGGGASNGGGASGGNGAPGAVVVEVYGQ